MRRPSKAPTRLGRTWISCSEAARPSTIQGQVAQHNLVKRVRLRRKSKRNGESSCNHTPANVGTLGSREERPYNRRVSRLLVVCDSGGSPTTAEPSPTQLGCVRSVVGASRALHCSFRSGRFPQSVVVTHREQLHSFFFVKDNEQYPSFSALCDGYQGAPSVPRLLCISFPPYPACHYSPLPREREREKEHVVNAGTYVRRHSPTKGPRGPRGIVLRKTWSVHILLKASNSAVTTQKRIVRRIYHSSVQVGP